MGHKSGLYKFNHLCQCLCTIVHQNFKHTHTHTHTTRPAQYQQNVQCTNRMHQCSYLNTLKITKGIDIISLLHHHHHLGTAMQVDKILNCGTSWAAMEPTVGSNKSVRQWLDCFDTFSRQMLTSAPWTAPLTVTSAVW